MRYRKYNPFISCMGQLCSTQALGQETDATSQPAQQPAETTAEMELKKKYLSPTGETVIDPASRVINAILVDFVERKYSGTTTDETWTLGTHQDEKTKKIHVAEVPQNAEVPIFVTPEGKILEVSLKDIPDITKLGVKPAIERTTGKYLVATNLQQWPPGFLEGYKKNASWKEPSDFEDFQTAQADQKPANVATYFNNRVSKDRSGFLPLVQTDKHETGSLIFLGPITNYPTTQDTDPIVGQRPTTPYVPVKYERFFLTTEEMQKESEAQKNVEQSATATTLPADKDKIAGLPKWLYFAILLGGGGVVLYFLSRIVADMLKPKTTQKSPLILKPYRGR